VLGCGTAVFDDLFEYMNSLHDLRGLMIPQEGKEAKEIITVIYPGEGGTAIEEGGERRGCDRIEIGEDTIGEERRECDRIEIGEDKIG
jgi:hypothetical protein